ncbi:hypothetical protein BHF71_02615 [Vulcanibacillus modesticaldus]|uniref:Rqc2 homolog RqcH n=1 Tax=Vulcanibacillus modesticaldus TaxID=337097 RepID=A0A1D2YTS0_9BACI|nr:NFACT RNA binding domain-containing protein [Vulcanibacillus modesticaldus]OEF99094.1 hypothetical protein BHF71_02615 [Vulcanibacillus modesticaldus]
MAFDGFVIRALVHELSEKLLHTKIHKIYQPHQTDLLFILRGYGTNHSLLISANPTYPRMHLTKRNFVNPTEPPMFCMLLRKHLEGGIIEKIYQIDNERIIYIDVKVRDELGDFHQKRLIVEIMGRHSNIILINPDNNLILDGINHVTAAVSSYRQVLPGKEYIAPPKQNKLNPLTLEQEQFFSLIKLNEGKIDKQFVNNFTGMSPTIAKEILYRAGLPTKENLWNAFYDWMEKTNNHNYNPAIVVSKEKTDFSIFPLNHLSGETTSFESINECIEEFYDKKAERNAIRQKTLDLMRFLVTEKQKSEKKIEYLYQDLKEADQAEKFKLYGELITAHLYQIKRGDKEAHVVNYYDENQKMITIPLNPFKTPSENAQHFFKKYNKLKNSREYIETQLTKTKEEIAYLETIITQLENASIQDIEDIREELVEQGYLKERKRKKHKKRNVPEIEKFISSEGYTIYVGKNNRQNEYLTHKLASALDTWLHTKDIPGSHVVIKSKEFGEATLNEAAIIAAYYSKAKNSSNVPVDYTLIKYVKKPSGAKPGFVIYEKQKTLFVTPDETLIDNLRTTK